MGRKVEVLFSTAEYSSLGQRDLSTTTCVVFDILRATSTMLTAFSNGAAEIAPVSEIEEALALRTQDPKLLLAGERGGHRIRAAQTDSVDFDFGNSPREFTRGKVEGRRIAITTTNGTRALRACAHAAEAQIGAFLNLSAAAAFVRASAHANVLLICAGTAEDASLEDTLAAGALVSLLASGSKEVEGAEEIKLTDSAEIALATYQHHASNLVGAFGKARNGRKLLSIPELVDDVAYCLQRDILNFTATLSGGVIRANR